MHKLTVIELQGLAPSLFCGFYFADQGSQVTIVSRSDPPPFSIPIHRNILNFNKKSIVLNFKQKKHRQFFKMMISSVDIIIDPYRPGVLEKMQFGPINIHKINKRAIVLRLSGFGQTNQNSSKPGHDINYLAQSGILPLINQNQKKYQFPTNYIADFVAASLGITAVLAALKQRQVTGKGKIIDCALTQGCKYYASIILQNQAIKNESKSQKKGKFITIGENLYYYTTQQKQTIAQLQQKIKDQKYYKENNLEISLVKSIPQFNLANLSNPFDAKRLNNFIKQRGQDTDEYLKTLSKFEIDIQQILRPKI